MMLPNEIEIYGLMIEYGIATQDELNLAHDLIGGSWQGVFDRVCYIRTGYRTFTEFLEGETASVAC